MKTEPRFSRYRVAIRSLNNKPILQSLAPLINLDTNAETDTIKQALITKYPMSALIIIHKPKKTAGIQALCAPADLSPVRPLNYLPTFRYFLSMLFMNSMTLEKTGPGYLIARKPIRSISCRYTEKTR